MYKSFTLYFIVYVITIIDYFLSFIIRKITIDVLCISITICNMLFKQIKIKNRCVFVSSLKIILKQ